MCIRTTNSRLISALVLAMVLAACGEKGKGDGNGEKAEKGKTQVAARVNDEEVTVHQLNQVLSMMGPAAAANPTDAGKSALENIINQTLGVQAAIKMKLDRDPAIMQAVEAAKQRVLLEAYVARSVPKATAPTDAEVHEYYSQHPELFANRHIYIFNQLAAKAGKESVDSLKSKVAGVKHMSEFVGWLKEKGVEYNAASDVKASEQLPLGLLAYMQKLKVGDLGYTSASDGVAVIEITQAIEQPLTEQRAKPLIERFLVNQKQSAAAQKLLLDMRASAKIEYMGDYKPSPKPEQAAQPQVAPQPPSATETPQSPKADAGYLEKGLKGL